MSITRKKLDSVRLKGHTVCFMQNVESLVKQLPRAPPDLPIIYIVSPQDSKRILKADRRRIEAALRWLIKYNRHYKDITIDTDALSMYPASYDFVDGIRTVVGEQELMEDGPDREHGPMQTEEPADDGQERDGEE